MGGRSSKPIFHLSETWKWIADLTPNRLERYGQYSMIATNSHRKAGLSEQESAFVRQQKYASAASLNYHLAVHFEHKYGYEPEWSVWNGNKFRDK